MVGKARKGARVFADTGEVHLKPEPAAVLKGGDLPENSIAFILDYEGEGFANIYTQGKVVSTIVAFGDYCIPVSESCQGEFLLPANERREPVWWVKVRLANGVTGWTDKPGRFGNMDACG